MNTLNLLFYVLGGLGLLLLDPKKLVAPVLSGLTAAKSLVTGPANTTTDPVLIQVAQLVAMHRAMIERKADDEARYLREHIFVRLLEPPTPKV